MNNLIFIAHRGESFDAPENTLQSINLAWKRDDDAVELDVRLTADNKIAVIHDGNTNRVGGIYLRVASQSLDSLKKIDVGMYKGNQWTKAKIPSLEEVLDTIPKNKKLFIEIKCGPKILNRLKFILADSNIKSDQIKLIGFSFTTLKKARALFNGYEIFWLKRIERRFLQFWKLNQNEIINIALKNKFDGLNIKYSKFINRNLVDKVRESGLKLFVWTVNETEIARKLIDYGVDGITSDRPNWLKKQIGL